MDGMWGFINESGTIIRSPEFDEVDRFEGGVAKVWLNERMGYVGPNGDYIWIPAQ
jgi:hypothetical protein